MALRSITDAKNVRFDTGTYDLRNFVVRTRRTNETIGKVDDVLVDERGRARYVCVQHAEDGRHMLLPVGTAEADQSRRTLFVPPMKRDGLRNVPSYSHQPASIDEEYEQRVARGYDSGYTADVPHDRPEYRNTWGRGSDRPESGRLERLDTLSDYKVAEGDPDPRGWKIIGRDGRTLGEVDHLIGDTGSMRVRYLAVQLDREIDRDRRSVLIPTGHVNLDTNRKRVIARGLDTGCVTGLPAYTGGSITRDIEQKIATVCEQPYSGDRRYLHPRYRDEHLWEEERIPRSEEEVKIGTRERQTGEVDVRKSVETERVHKPVTVHREEVEVERRPASGARQAEFRDREVSVPVTEEEVVVEKRPKVVEEIVVRKRDVADTEFVDETVRKERVDVDDRRPRQ